MRTFAPSLLLLAALCAATAAAAELFKWVDERGVTNYSNEPPPAAATARKLARVESTISVYTPDDSFMQVVKATRERALQALAEPEPPRSPVARIGPPSLQSGYEQCLASGRLGCDDLYRSYAPVYLPVAAVYPLRSVPQTRFLARPPASRADPTRVSRSAALR